MSINHTREKAREKEREREGDREGEKGMKEKEREKRMKLHHGRFSFVVVSRATIVTSKRNRKMKNLNWP